MDKKRGGGVQMTDTTLTKEQREFAAENHEIILSYLRGKRLDASEWYDVAVFGYLSRRTGSPFTTQSARRTSQRTRPK